MVQSGRADCGSVSRRSRLPARRLRSNAARSQDGIRSRASARQVGWVTRSRSACCWTHAHKVCSPGGVVGSARAVSAVASMSASVSPSVNGTTSVGGDGAGDRVVDVADGGIGAEVVVGGAGAVAIGAGVGTVVVPVGPGSTVTAHPVSEDATVTRPRTAVATGWPTEALYGQQTRPPFARVRRPHRGRGTMPATVRRRRGSRRRVVSRGPRRAATGRARRVPTRSPGAPRRGSHRPGSG